MNRFTLTVLVILVMLCLAPAAAASVPVDAPDAPTLTVPPVVSYQGQVTVDDAPYNRTGYFKFAIVYQVRDVVYTEWSNDGTSVAGSAPSASVALPVANGLFSVLLGDTNLPGMTQPMSPLGQGVHWLRVWFSPYLLGTYVQLTPDRRIASAPYALSTETLDGFHASDFQQHYQNVIVVAKSGGDFTTIEAALNSIPDATNTNRYLVWVGPGEYVERVTMKAYVDIEGAGEPLTKIKFQGCTNGVNCGTVVGASDAALRSLTVENTGGAEYADAFLSHYASSLTHVTANASGGSFSNTGIQLSSCSAVMLDVTASATGGTYNTGVWLEAGGGQAVITNLTATASGGLNSANLAAGVRGCNLTISHSALSATGPSTSWSRGLRCRQAANSYTVVVNNSSLQPFGATIGYGVTTETTTGDQGTVDVRINSSQVSGGSHTVHAAGPGSISIGASQLAGGPVYLGTGATVKCIGVYDENYESPGYTSCP